MSGMGQYLTICTSQLVEFLGSELQNSVLVVLLGKILDDDFFVKARNKADCLFFARIAPSRLISNYLFQNKFILKSLLSFATFARRLGSVSKREF